MKRATRRFQTAITAGVIAGTLLLPVSAYAENGSAAETDVTAATAETVPPEASVPNWKFTGVKLSATRVTSGQPVTVAPQVSGDLDGATYNYVWSYEGGWDLWGSTVRDTGRGTSDASSTLTLTRPGSYTVYVDVTDRAGEKRTMSATLEVASPEWEFTGVSLSASRVTSGEPVTVTPQVTGDLDGAAYNYVWQRNGSWAEGEWGSTVKDTGRGTGEATGTLTLTRPGTYTVYVDVTDRSGQTRTMSATLEVASPEWSFSGVELSASSVTSGEPVTVTPQVTGDLGGATYNYVWQRNGSWAEGEWGSTVLSSGSGTSDASSTLSSEVSRPGTYTVYVDVTDRSGQTRTMSATLEVAPPEWSFTGVEVSSPRVRVDEPVTVTPQVSGDLAGATYNYVWSYGGGWDLWGSTVRDTGKGTSEASSELSFYRPGRYVLYVDVTDRAGETRTMSAGVEAYDDSWSLDGVTASPAEVVAGDEVTCAPVVSGDASGLRYNYVWQWEGSWAQGDWGSTELYTGSDTDEASHTGALGTPGRYTLYVDAVSARGERRTASTRVVAWGVTGATVSTPDGGATWTAKADLFEGHEVPGTKYRFRWTSVDGSASGTLRDWSTNSSVNFPASTVGNQGGIYRIYLDVQYPNGKQSTLAANDIPGKVGYQNPSGYPQVSRFNVVLPSYATDPHWNFVMPSRISVNATRSECIETFISVAYEYMAKGTTWVDNHCSYPGDEVDCSGMIMEGLYACGMSLDGVRGGDFNPYSKYYWNHHIANTWRESGTFKSVSLAEIQRGDIIYYDGHVAIYIGNGQIIDSSSVSSNSYSGVSVRSMYFPARILGVARPFI